MFYKRVILLNKDYTGRAVTNVVRTCGPAHLLIFDFMSSKICLNQTNKDYIKELKTVE